MDIDELAKTFIDDLDRQRKAVCDQTLVNHDEDLADALMAAGEVVGCLAESELYAAGSAIRGVYFILHGKVELFRDGNHLAHVAAQNQVGSWPVLFADPTYDVTATAIEDTVLLIVGAQQFRETANRFPEMWERLARSQANRLKKMGELYLPINEVPRLLIGSSSEYVEIAQYLAKQIQKESQHEIKVDLWTEVFPPGRSNLESLTSGLDDWDFAVFLFTPDDYVISREVTRPAPRDNIVFEAGLCMGRLGRTRTLLLVPKEPERLKRPSDLKGIGLLFYEESVDEQLEKLLGIIADLGPRTRLAIHKLDE